MTLTRRACGGASSRAVSRVLAMPASSRISTAGSGRSRVGSASRSSASRVERPRLRDAGLLGELAHGAGGRRDRRRPGSRRRRRRWRSAPAVNVLPVPASASTTSTPLPEVETRGSPRPARSGRGRSHAASDRARQAPARAAHAFAAARLVAAAISRRSAATRSCVVSAPRDGSHARCTSARRGTRPAARSTTAPARPARRAPPPTRSTPRVGERVRLLGQPGRAGELGRRPRCSSGRAGCSRRPRAPPSPSSRGHRARARPRGRETSCHGASRPRTACARGCRARSPRGPLGAPRRPTRQLALALLDLAPARGELPQHLGGNLLELGRALAHRPPLAPTAGARAPRRAGATGTGSPPPWRARKIGVASSAVQRPSAPRAMFARPHACAAADPRRGSSDADTPPPRTPPPPRAAPRRGRVEPDTPHARRTPAQRAPPPRAPRPAPGQSGRRPRTAR